MESIEFAAYESESMKCCLQIGGIALLAASEEICNRNKTNKKGSLLELDKNGISRQKRKKARSASEERQLKKDKEWNSRRLEKIESAELLAEEGIPFFN